jgi:hypothetical protein
MDAVESRICPCVSMARKYVLNVSTSDPTNPPISDFVTSLTSRYPLSPDRNIQGQNTRNLSATLESNPRCPKIQNNRWLGPNNLQSIMPGFPIPYAFQVPKSCISRNVWAYWNTQSDELNIRKERNSAYATADIDTSAMGDACFLTNSSSGAIRENMDSIK